MIDALQATNVALAGGHAAALSQLEALLARREGGEYIAPALVASIYMALGDEGAALDYTLGSAGKDGGTTLSLVGAGGPTGTFDADIVFTRGVFVQWPEGLQE